VNLWSTSAEITPTYPPDGPPAQSTTSALINNKSTTSQQTLTQGHSTLISNRNQHASNPTRWCQEEFGEEMRTKQHIQFLEFVVDRQIRFHRKRDFVWTTKYHTVK
jgi:hypothetical protein